MVCLPHSFPYKLGDIILDGFGADYLIDFFGGQGFIWLVSIMGEHGLMFR